MIFKRHPTLQKVLFLQFSTENTLTDRKKMQPVGKTLQSDPVVKFDGHNIWSAVSGHKFYCFSRTCQLFKVSRKPHAMFTPCFQLKLPVHKVNSDTGIALWDLDGMWYRQSSD